jgi:hypothetical protein
MTRRRARGEDGATLMLAIAFLLLFSLIIAALLSQEQTSIRTTPVVDSHGKKLYAADGGVDYGIQTVRSIATLCPDVNAQTQDVGDVTLNGRAVHVTCKTLAGDNGAGGTVFGQSGWTTVATGYGTPSWPSTGKTNCGSPSTATDLGSTIQIVGCGISGSVQRTITDGVLTTTGGPAQTKALTSATANFVQTDVGATLVGNGIPAGTKINQVNTPTKVTMSAAATVAGTGVTVVIGGQQAVTFGGTKVFNAGGFNIPASISGVIQGSVTQYNISPSNYCTRDQGNAHYPIPNDKNPKVGAAWLCTTPNATAIPDPTPHVVVPPDPVSRTITDAVLSKDNHGNLTDILTSASAHFTSADVNAILAGAGIVPGATVKKVNSPTSIQMSAKATSLGNGTVTITPSSTAPPNQQVACGGTNITYIYPGRYTSAPWGGKDPNGNNNGPYYYFASGVYYFHDSGETALGGTAFVGGEPGPNDQRFVPLLAGCEAKFTDAAADGACGGCLPADPGKGVTFIIGGGSLFDIHGGTTELFSRVPGTMDAGATPGTTMWAIANAPAPAPTAASLASGGSYAPLANDGADRCNCAFVTDKSLQQIIFHGLTYTPNSPIDVYNNAGTSYSPFYGGLVASWIVARVDANSQSGLFTGQFGATLGPSKRTIKIVATAAGTAPGETATTSTAIIEVDVDSNKTTTVDSWRNQ